MERKFKKKTLKAGKFTNICYNFINNNLFLCCTGFSKLHGVTAWVNFTYVFKSDFGFLEFLKKFSFVLNCIIKQLNFNESKNNYIFNKTEVIQFFSLNKLYVK